MKVLDYNLSSSINGGKVTAFNYSRSLSELAGSWSADVAGGNFKAGSSIDFSGVMKDGIISRAFKDADGLWHIEREEKYKEQKNTHLARAGLSAIMFTCNCKNS